MSVVCVLSFQLNPRCSLVGIPIKDMVFCAMGLVPFHYVSVSLDENIKLCVAQVAKRGKKNVLEKPDTGL